MRKLGLLAVSGVLAAAPLIGLTVPADAAILGVSGHSAILHASATGVVHTWKNCTIVNQRLPHGVGRSDARDHTSGTPVRNFRHDTAMYRRAMSANRSLDRDKDGIACEKR